MKSIGTTEIPTFVVPIMKQEGISVIITNHGQMLNNAPGVGIFFTYSKESQLTVGNVKGGCLIERPEKSNT